MLNVVAGLSLQRTGARVAGPIPLPQLNAGCTLHLTLPPSTGTCDTFPVLLQSEDNRPPDPRLASSPGEKYGLWRLSGSRIDWPKIDWSFSPATALR